MATLAKEAGVRIDPLDVSRPELYRDDLWQAPFRELRAKSPVHYVEDSGFGPYWSISSYKPIVQAESLP
ncbi:MAG: cytochrome P450, partial [Sphingomonas sp.]